MAVGDPGIAAFDGGEGDFRGWVFTVARRRAIDWARRLAASRASPPPLASTSWTRRRSVRSSSTPRRPWRPAGAPPAVDPDQREVVALRVIAGMTVSETAAVVNKSEGAVRVLSHRGLRSLAVGSSLSRSQRK